MRIERGLSPNCSEAVFRFYTEDPKIAMRILRAFADEVGRSKDLGSIEITSMEGLKHATFAACAGLGDPVAVPTWEPDKRAFVLNIGNNDISPDGKGCATVRELGIEVEEAGTSPSLSRDYARDCTCGILFFEDYEKLKIEEEEEDYRKPNIGEEKERR